MRVWLYTTHAQYVSLIRAGFFIVWVGFGKLSDDMRFEDFSGQQRKLAFLVVSNLEKNKELCDKKKTPRPPFKSWFRTESVLSSLEHIRSSHR